MILDKTAIQTDLALVARYNGNIKAKDLVK